MDFKKLHVYLFVASFIVGLTGSIALLFVNVAFGVVVLFFFLAITGLIAWFVSEDGYLG
ncbi:MAG: hypothetical protein LBV67_04510 [Streptococcaceae bacterium]|nr:hypothetical protein [Streptococcaceae bacterium]